MPTYTKHGSLILDSSKTGVSHSADRLTLMDMWNRKVGKPAHVGFNAMRFAVWGQRRNQRGRVHIILQVLDGVAGCSSAPAPVIVVKSSRRHDRVCPRNGKDKGFRA